MAQHTPIKRSRSPQRRQRFSTASSVRLDLLCPFHFRSSSNTFFTGAHQNTLENVPVVVLTWVLFSSRTLVGLITLFVGQLYYYRTLISALRYPIPAAAACGLWSASRIMYMLRYGSGDPKKVFVFYTKSAWGRKSESHPLNPARTSGQVELPRPDWWVNPAFYECNASYLSVRTIGLSILSGKVVFDLVKAGI